jgi:hypothetical protein
LGEIRIRQYPLSMLEEFGRSIYAAGGPTVSFGGFPYPTRMAVVRLSQGDVWVWSPIALTEQLADQVQAIGPVRYIVSPNKLHHLFLREWVERWPDAHLYAPPGLARKRSDLRFRAELEEEPDPSWAADIDQTIFRGSFAMQEVAFFHRASRTAIIGDLIQRLSKTTVSGWRGVVMQLGGLVGPNGSTPPDWRASFLRRGPARVARNKVLNWNAERVLIAHGECARSGAAEIIAAALRWI